MITLTIQNRKTKASKVEVFQSKDKAEEHLNTLRNDKTWRLIAISTDTESEEAIVRPFLDEANEKALKEKK